MPHYQRPPSEAHKIFVEFFAERINRYLDEWPPSLDSMGARRLLAERIIKDDE